MKSSISQKLNRFLLLTTFLVAPSLAFAQAPVEEEVQAEEGEIVVLGRFIPEPMRETSEVAAFLSAEDLARQGDDTAAGALTRLTGLSVMSGRFVFVRGLGDRYSSALLNGSPLPSPEPLRRTVPLDLFPSNILEGATVQKTFSPNYPGEFGGGVIDLQTIDAPVAPFLTVKFGSGVNPETTSRHGLIYHGGDTDWLGFDDGLRDIPAPLADAIAQNVIVSDVNFDTDTLEAIGESFVNSPLTVIQTQDISPDTEFEVTGGASFQQGDVNVGVIGVVGYDSSWRTEIARRELVADSPGVLYEDFNSETTRWDVTLNALGGVSVGWDDHELKLTGLYVHSSTKEAQISQGFDFNAIGATPCLEVDTCVDNRFNESTAWYERELASVQLAGEHEFGPLAVSWRGSAARSTRDAPYERSLQRLIGGDGVPAYVEANKNATRFSELTDDVVSGGVDLAYTVPLSEERDAIFSAGYFYSNTVRNYELLQFVFGGNLLPGEEDVSIARADFLFSPDNIDPQRFEIIELTGPDDAYKGGLLVNAAYASADVELIPLLRAAVGVRYEEGRQTVRTSNRYGAASSAPVLIENQYWLPAATLTWNFAEDLQLRLGYSQTIARPQFRELAISPYLDPDTDRIYRGNPGLVDSELVNYDARLEYYFGRNQFVTGGVFYKDIENPIEEVLTSPSGGNFVTNFINAPRAVIYGAEAEYRTTFDSPIEGGFFDGKTWFFAINYTYTFSEVQADDGDIVINPSDGQPTPASVFALDGSQLQGTPENILNVQFGFETDESQLTLLLGWVDQRILRRGFGTGLEDVIEDPGIQLDLVYRRDFVFNSHDFTFGLSGRNLLDEAHREFQQSDDLGDIETNTYDRGMSFSASLTAKF